ncbi:MAG: hypothetical protein ABS949_08935 [Solibacillus sp.]
MTQQKVKINYNGILLLTSYLHRVYVSEQIQHVLHKKDKGRLEEVKTMLDDVGLMRTMYEQTQALTDTQKTKLLAMSEKVKLYMNDFFPAGEATFANKLTLVAASLYGEQAMNDGILRMFKLYGEEVKGDFEARVQFYKDRTRAMDIMVHNVEKNEDIPQQMIDLVEQWYANIDKQRSLVLSDMSKIDQMLLYNK